MTVNVPLITFIDLDNLIIDTNKLFEDAHLDILSDLEKVFSAKGPRKREERLRYVRDLDELIIQRTGKKTYDAAILVRAVGLKLLGEATDYVIDVALMEPTVERLPAAQIKEIADKFTDFAFVSGIPALRPGVKQALDKLQYASDKLVLVTENKNTGRCARILEHHGLTSYFNERLLVGVKTTQTYIDLAQRHPATPALPQIMIGDQLDSDIAYAQHAGFTTIHVPGGFRPNYAQTQAMLVKPDYQATTLAEAADIVRAIRHNMARSFHLATTEYPATTPQAVTFRPF